MKTIAFYSFKGGVGRSSLVLNVGHALAAKANFVVIADWDLHAPGLSVTPSLAMPDGPACRKGILDFLMSAVAGEGEVSIIDPKQLAQPTQLAVEAHAVRRSFGDLYFVPAGRFGAGEAAEYPGDVRQLPLRDFAGWEAAVTPDGEPRRVLEFFRERIAEVRSPRLGDDRPPDYLLLDSRTGVTEIGDLLLGQFTDHYVVVTGLNEQNQLGTEMVVRDLQAQCAPGELSDVCTVVVSPVPIGEEALLRARLDALDGRLRGLARPLPGMVEPERLPAIFEVPYHPRLALSEEVLVASWPRSGPARAYVEIAEHLRQGQRTVAQVRAEARVEILEAMPAPAGRPVERQPGAQNPFEVLPRWDWPAPGLTAAEVLGQEMEGADELLDGLAWSLAVGAEEKRRVLSRAVEMGAPRRSLLLDSLVHERERLRRTWRDNEQDLGLDLARAMLAWVDLLAERGHCSAPEAWSALAARPRDDAFLDGATRLLEVGWVMDVSDASRREEASRLADRATERGISTAREWWLLAGIRLQASRDLDAAEVAALRATALAPDYPNALYMRAMVRWRRHDWVAARRDLEAVTRLAPHSANAWVSLAHLLTESPERDLPAAATAAEHAEACELDDLDLLNLIELALQAGDEVAAGRRLARALRVGTRRLLVFQVLALGYALRRGDLPEAARVADWLEQRARERAAPDPDWDFTHLVRSLAALAPADLGLLEAATRLARGEIDPDTYHQALTTWRQTHGLEPAG